MLYMNLAKLCGRYVLMLSICCLGASRISGQTVVGSAPTIALGATATEGIVLASENNVLIIKSDTGATYKVNVGVKTQIRRGSQIIKVVDIHAGDRLRAVGVVDATAKTIHPLALQVIPAEDLKKLQDSLGKSFILGTVTAIHGVDLTILRVDKISQIIHVDEGTSFKIGKTPATQRGHDSLAPRRGDSVTLGDIRIGDQVFGRGSIQNQKFVPSDLSINQLGTR